MVDVSSEFVGTEKKIDLVGRFNCIIETVKKTKSDDTKTEKDVVCKLTVPTGYHFKVGYMASFNSPDKPDMKITDISYYTNHCVCTCETWK